jgi:hypothetical protein
MNNFHRSHLEILHKYNCDCSFFLKTGLQFYVKTNKKYLTRKAAHELDPNRAFCAPP